MPTNFEDYNFILKILFKNNKIFEIFIDNRYFIYYNLVENMPVVENGLTTGVNSSNLFVNVIKDTNGQQTTIYSGTLEGYANGAFTDMDFTGIDFMVVCDWESLEEEAIYVMLSTSQVALETKLSDTVAENAIKQKNKVKMENRTHEATIQTNMSIMYNNEYYENVLLPGQTLTIPIAITNTGITSVDIVPYIAKYDLSGRLIDLIQGNLITVPANQDYYIRFSGIENNDYEITSAVPNELITLAKNIGTSSNLFNNSDFNLYRFIPTVTGNYIITAVDSNNVKADLYAW